MTTPQDKAQIEHLRQVCQERDGRIQQLEQELGKARQELQNTTQKCRELSERETTSVACSTEDLPTNEERVEHAASGYGFADVGSQGARAVSGFGFVNSSVEGSIPQGPYSQSAEELGPQNSEYAPPRKHLPPEGPSRTQTPSVPGSPARRHVMSRESAQGASGRGSAQGYQLPPTPPSGGRGSRGRRNSAGGGYV